MVGVLLPFLATMFYALLVPNGKNKHVGYVGSLAGVLTLILLWTLPPTSLHWFSLGNLAVVLETLRDPISLTFGSVIAGIGVLVFFYSVGYFEKGEDLRRYYAVLSLFAWSMLGVVLSDNLFMMFFCWELVGVSSYLLIGFWHHKPSAVAAARKSYLTIIIGDVCLLGAVFLLAHEYNSLSISSILSQLEVSTVTIVAGIGVLGGVLTKSAQFPFNGWLADAMEGPTPVSAYLHSATMVKAGLFLLVRFLPLIVIAGLANWVLVLALFTILLSGSIALVETDIKRVLAYSTMNQLAFMMVAFSLGAIVAGMFHLVVHSIFKALLFFISGIIIHAAGTQNLLKIRIKRGLNLVYVTSLIGVLALAGLVPFSGFFSKEGIVDAVVETHSWEIWLLFGIAIVLSAAYITRWFLLLFSPKGKQAHSAWQLVAPLPVLAILAAVGGIALGPFFAAWDAPVPHIIGMSALVSTVLVLTGISASFFVHKSHKNFNQSVVVHFLREGAMIDELYSAVVRATMRTAQGVRWFENNIVNRLVRTIAASVVRAGSHFRYLHTGRSNTYAVALILGFLIITLVLGVFA